MSSDLHEIKTSLVDNLPLPITTMGAASGSLYSEFLADDAGLISAISNYSGQNYAYFNGPALGEIWHVSRFLACIQDSGGLDAGSYGNNLTLTTGIRMGTGPGTVSSGASIVTDLLDGQTIRTNAEWGRYSFDIMHQDFGVGNEFLQILWTFTEAGTPLVLNGDNSDKFMVVMGDSLIGLVDHSFLVQGVVFGA